MTTPRNVKLEKDMWPGGGAEAATQPYPANPECGISTVAYLYDDFIGSTINTRNWYFYLSGAGSGSTVLVPDGIGGQLQLTSNNYIIEMYYAATTICSWIRPWECTWRAKIVTESGYAVVRFGVVGTGNQYVVFEHETGLSQWRCKSYAGASYTSFEAGVFQVDVWQELRIVCPGGPSGPHRHLFYLNGDFLGQNETDLTQDTLCPYVFNSSISGDAVSKVDFVEILAGRS